MGVLLIRHGMQFRIRLYSFELPFRYLISKNILNRTFAQSTKKTKQKTNGETNCIGWWTEKFSVLGKYFRKYFPGSWKAIVKIFRILIAFFKWYQNFNSKTSRIQWISIQICFFLSIRIQFRIIKEFILPFLGDNWKLPI